MKSRAIISSVAGEHYFALQHRTKRACFKWGNAHVFSERVSEPWDYRKKLDMIEMIVGLGYRFVLWMDVSFMPVAHLEPLWDRIEGQGWFAPKQGDARLGTWASDAALDGYGISRDVASEIPMCFSGLVGIDTQSAMGRKVVLQWRALADTFAGAHYNRPGEEIKPMGNKTTGHCSNDPRVEGHRHDEAALSFALWSLGLKPAVSTFLSIDHSEGYIIGRNFVNLNGTYAD